MTLNRSSEAVSRSLERLRRCLTGLACIGLIAIGGCANGDFGRPRSSVVREEIHDWVGGAAIGGPASDFRLTDDERALRDLAYPLIDPSNDHRNRQSVWAHYGLARAETRVAPVDRADYWLQLNNDFRRSETSGYSRIVTDARNDVERIDPFFRMAARVVDLDQKRAKSLPLVSGLTPAEERNAVRRNQENLATIRWVCRALNERAASYRYALERMVVAAPSPMAVEAERAIGFLQSRTGQYCRPSEAKA